MAALGSQKILQSELPVSRYIPYSHHVTPTIISTKNGDYLSIWRLGGRSHQSAAAEDVCNWTRELNNLMRGIGNAHISFWSHVVRRRVYEYPDNTFDNSFCRQLDERYRESFTNYNLMVNDLYLTVLYRPVMDKFLSFLSRRERVSFEQRRLLQEKHIKALEDVNRTIAASFRRYDAALLGTYDHKGNSYSSALEFLARLLNAEQHPMPVANARMSDYMVLNRPLFSTWGEVGEIRTAKGAKRFGMLDITDYSDATEPGQLNGLLEVPFEFVLTQSFSTLSRHAAKGFLQRHKQLLMDAKDVAYQQIQEIDEALNQLVSGQFVMGEHHGTLTVFGENAPQVRDHLALASATLLDVGIISKVVDLALECGFWAQLPGNWAYRPRPAPITSLNFLSFSPFHNFMSGKPNGNPWGAAVTILKTVSGTPLYFNFHASKIGEDTTGQRLLGNTVMIGKSGTGKTVTLGFLLAQAQKYQPTVVAFDKDRGMEIVIRAMGGRYLPLKTGLPSGFNPLQLPPTPNNMQFLKQFIKKLASAGGAPITHSDEEEINRALHTMMFHIDRPLRRLSMLLQSLPNPLYEGRGGHPTVHARLLKWCEGGEYGWLFDNPEDALDLTSHRLYGFDITEFLENPETRGPTMMYLVFRTEGMIDGRRFIYVFDEFWKALSDPYFEDLAKNKQKTIRKQNGIFVFATQEPSDALESPIAKTLVQQCATYVFLPNPSADYQDYIQGFKLTDTEFELIRSLGEDSRKFLIKQGGNSAIAQLNLHGFDDELLVLSGTPDNAELVEEIIAEVGEEPAVWLPIFYNRARLKTSVVPRPTVGPVTNVVPRPTVSSHSTIGSAPNVISMSNVGPMEKR
jgi:type IV secretion system protein VirB4